MKKLKKYVLMIPLLAVMLLNCVCYGQLIASASNTFDYVFNEYYRDRMHHYDELKVDFDFSDADAMIENYIASSGVGVAEYYIYFLYANTNNYHNFSSFEIYLDFYFVRDGLDSIVYNQNVIYFSSYDYHCTFNYNRSTSLLTNLDFSNSSFTNASDRVTSYCPSTGFHYNVHSGLFGDNNKYNAFTEDYCYLYQGTNIPDFPLPYEQVDNSLLNVNVTFSPELTGAFNRTVTDRGQKVTLDEFSFTVENNSKFDIQYIMAIYREGDSFLPFNTDLLSAQTYTKFTGKTYIGNPVYVYVKDEWLYLPHGQQGIITGYAPSSWHKVSSGSSDLVTINFNQLNLITYTNYNVCVYAIRNDLNYVSPFTNYNTFQYPSCEGYHLELDTMQNVYSSTFSILNPATFDPTNNDNSYAFDTDDRLLFNRANGYIDENGEMIIDRVDTNQWVTSGSDDPWVNWDSDNDAWETYYKNQNTVSSDIDQLSNNFSSFFKFVNKIFSYFPKNYQNIIMLGLTSIVVLGVIKVVF